MTARQKIVITGGAGFIGSHLAEHYAQVGKDVLVIDNLSRAQLLHADDTLARYNWDYLGRTYSNIELISGDVRNADDMDKYLQDSSAIIHCAAQTAVTTSMECPRPDFECNAGGTFNILEAARKSGCNPKVIFCSTNKVYGENVNEIQIEQHAKRYAFSEEQYRLGVPESLSVDHCSHTPYGCSKLAGDLYTQDYGRYYNLKTCVFRMSCIYGTRQFGVEDQGWVAHFVISALQGRDIRIYGDGKQVRDVLHISDLVRAFDSFIAGETDSDVFNLGGGVENTLSLLELIDLLEQLLAKKIAVSYFPWRPSDQRVYISDVSKVRDKLGWAPQVNPIEGIENLVDWIKHNREIFYDPVAE